ncbi:MAG: DUF4126 domain-containing protein [bacterium]
MNGIDLGPMESVISLAIGLGLSAACGFRVFVPLLALSIGARAGYLPLSPDFAWVATTPALIAFAAATVLEIAAYFIPWLDNALDSVATPAAILGGVVATASLLTDLPPLVRWSVALIAGGGTAGVVQGATVLARLKSTALTGGLANPVVALFELAGSIVTSLIAIVLPIVCIVLVATACIALFVTSRRFLFGRTART